MIIGIGGCTALLITGYGIQDSISNVVDYQYSEITRYDASVTFQHALNETERTAFAALCEEEAKEYLFVAEKSADASAGSTVKTTNVVCPASGSVEGFVDLHEKDKTPVAYPKTARASSAAGWPRRCSCRRATPSRCRAARAKRSCRSRRSLKTMSTTTST